MAAYIERRRERFRTLNFVQRAQRAFAIFVDQNAKRVERAAGLLKAFSYQGVLARGFALVRDAAGHPLRAAATVSPGMALDIEFADGRVAAIADGADGAPKATPGKPRRGGGGGQGSLFG
jgi:exodeoxyribonuclease VII large subunit